MINSLYVHIPFCVRKCLYCDFNSYGNVLNLQDEYIDSLLLEIDSIKQSKFKTIFIGGGTPTILSLYNLKRLTEKLSKFSADEFTIEANPGTVDLEKLNILKDCGVNRISLGFQAWQDRLLKKLGRIHSCSDFLKSYEMIKSVGFKNINIDLMFAIPEQNFEDWVETLKCVADLKPRHLSCYSLIVEEGTPFYDMYNEGKLKLVDEDTEREMYYYCVDYLKDRGYERYEISNFAMEGFSCRHNITYWRDEEYIGVGAGAHSYVSNVRYNNKYGITDYIKGIKTKSQKDNITQVYVNDEMSEFMFLGLRMTHGIEKERFKNRFNKDIYDIYGKEIDELIKYKLIVDNGSFLYLTKRGIDVSNQVFIKFML